jgi:hypothetical protein
MLCASFMARQEEDWHHTVSRLLALGALASQPEVLAWIRPAQMGRTAEETMDAPGGRRSGRRRGRNFEETLKKHGRNAVWTAWTQSP